MSFFSVHHLIQLLHAYGNPVLATIVGLECLGLPLPGETLLIAAAVYAGTTHQLNIVLVVLSAAIGAIVGQIAAYWVGWSVGFRLLRHYGRYLGLTDRRLAFGRALFRKHGEKVVIAARFIVFLRTVAGLLAGANHMPWHRFMIANVGGSVAWAVFYGFGAYALGHTAKHLAGPVAIGIAVIVGVGVTAAALYVRHREHRLLAQPIRRSAG